MNILFLYLKASVLNKIIVLKQKNMNKKYLHVLRLNETYFVYYAVGFLCDVLPTN